MSDYEATRQANIARNKALLQSLGLDKPFFEPKEKPYKPAKAPKKRKAADVNVNDDGHAKMQRTDSDGVTPSGLRRSQRCVGKTVNYAAERIDSLDVPASIKSGIRGVDDVGPLGRSAGSKRIHNPKTFGSIPGIEVGTWWETREGCSADAVHAPWVAGIAPSKNGAYSVALSGGYDDDVDLGYAFTYTGSGGRDLKGTKAKPKNLRTAPQSSDQSFENNFNRALKRSVETKKPVRVIRGYKLRSRYAPSEGYRYDGLYRVEKAWMEQGLEGFLVCKFAFKRIARQAPLPVRDDGTIPADVEKDAQDVASTQASEGAGDVDGVSASDNDEGSEDARTECADRDEPPASEDGRSTD